MKNINIFNILLVALAILTSCEDKLDVVDPNKQSSAGFWTTDEEVAEGVIAIYNRLLTDGCYGRMTPSLNDVRGDGVWSNSPWPVYPMTAEFTVLNDEIVLTWVWREWYIMVYRANLVLKYIDDVEWSDQDYKNRILGQSLFLRALANYNLTETYETVPLINYVPVNEEDFYQPSTPRDEILNYIIRDLDLAASLLPVSYADVSGLDKNQHGRATKGAALGLLARIYMIQKDWSNAQATIEDIMDLKIYDLVDNYADNFTYSNENNKESIFEIQFGNYGTDENWGGYSTSNWRQAHALGYNYGITAFGAWGDMKPTNWLYNEFKEERTVDGGLDPRLYSTIVSYEPEYDTATDGRTNMIFGTNAYNNGTLNQGDIFIAKYTYARIPGHTSEQDGQRIGNIINYRFMRYAEVLLNYAEVLFELDQFDAAYAPLNEIRDRAGLALLTVGSLSNTDLYEEIVHQRVLELSVEGIRHFDIKRWGWFYEQARLNELISHDNEFGTWVEGHEYLPIPSSELDLNKKLAKNSAN